MSQSMFWDWMKDWERVDSSEALSLRALPSLVSAVAAVLKLCTLVFLSD